MAVHLEVATPQFAVVQVDERAIQTMPQALAERVQPGYAFGSLYVELAEEPKGLRTITTCSNHRELLSRLLVLDTWIGTQDRMKPEIGRNLLVDVEKPATLMAIDFGMSFPEAVLPLVGEAPPSEQVEVAWDRAELLKEPILDMNVIREALDQAEAMTDSDIQELLSAIPDAWLAEDGRKRLLSYITTRRSLVRAAVLRGLRRGA
jgi:hypothetical protein